MRKLSRLILACTVFAPLAASADVANGNLTVSAEVQPTCSVAAATLDFGIIDTTNTVGSTGNATIDVTCTSGTPATVGLNNGLHYDATEGRRMADGTQYLRYRLYTTAALDQEFGLAAPGVVSITGSGTATPVTVYGKIVDNQTSVPAGSYTDTVTIEVTF